MTATTPNPDAAPREPTPGSGSGSGSNTGNSPDPEEAALWPAWFAAAGETGTDHALRGFYNRLDEEVRRRGPVCFSSGKCCNFDAYGHRLYVTGLEIAWVVRQLPAANQPTDHASQHHPTVVQLQQAGATVPPHGNEATCRFQVDRLCSVHTIRPMGCRIFFCERGTEEWQHDLYERFLTELRVFHEATKIPYRYMEWRQGLREAFAVAPAGRDKLAGLNE